MKNVILIIGILIFYMVISNVLTTNNLIPTDAIRVRVIANSDNEEDQLIKEGVKTELEMYLYEQLKDIESAEEAGNIIQNKLHEIDSLVLSSLGSDFYSLDYGMNYFPKKEYKGITYEDGYYQSLVVTIGYGEGSNWWCVLFPPLCLLEGTEMSDVEYRTVVSDIINKYF